MAYADVQQTLAPEVAAPDDILRRRRMAQAMLANSMSGESIGHWTQGLAQLAQAMMGGYQMHRANQDEKAGQASASQAIMDALGGLGTGSTGDAAAPSGSAGNISAEGGDVGNRLMGDLQRDFQLSPEQAAGVVGNLAHESGGFRQMQEISPTVPGSRGGYGYAQWTGPRRKAFEQFASGNRMDPASYDANYGFLKHELTNTPEGRVMAALRMAPNARAASDLFQQQFLRPGIPHTDRRRALAEQMLAGRGETAEAPNAQPVAFAPSPDVMQHIGAGPQATPAGLSISPTPQAPPQPMQQQAARIPQPRPTPPAGAPPPPTPASAPAVAPSGPPPAGRAPLMQEPYSGPMSAEQFARQAPAALRGQQPGPTPPIASAYRQTPTAPQQQAQQPRAGIMQALMGRRGSPAASMAQYAPQGNSGAQGGQRGQMAALLTNPYVPDSVKGVLLARMMPQAGEPYTLGPGQTRFGPDGQPLSSVPPEPPKPFAPQIAKPGDTLVGPDGQPLYSAPPDQMGKFKDVSSLRKEIQELPSYKSYQLAVPAVNSMAESMNKDTAAADLDFIYALARVFDPNSVVREGEMILVQNTQNLPQQIQAAIARVTGGSRLDTATRRNLWDAASGRMNQYREQIDADLGTFKGIADRYGINHADIIPDLVELKEPSAPAQQSGPARPTSREEFDALPSGTRFIDPEGNERIKP